MFEISYFPLTSNFIGLDQLTKTSENSLALPKVFSAIFVCKRFDIAFSCSFFLSLLCKESPYAIFTLHSNIHISPVSLIFRCSERLVIWLNPLYPLSIDLPCILLSLDLLCWYTATGPIYWKRGMARTRERRSWKSGYQSQMYTPCDRPNRHPFIKRIHA